METKILIRLEVKDGCTFQKKIPYHILIAILTYCKLNNKQLIDFQKSFPNLLDDMEKYFDKMFKYFGIHEIDDIQEVKK
jgi:hypothetical protein